MSRASRSPSPARPPRGPRPTAGEALITTGTARLEQDRDDPDGWMVHVNGVPSSYVDLADPTNLVFEYHQWTAAVVDAVHPAGEAGLQPLRAVHLGGAGCAFPRYLAATRPGSRQLVLEVDERLVDLVRRSFGATARRGSSSRSPTPAKGSRASPRAPRTSSSGTPSWVTRCPPTW